MKLASASCTSPRLLNMPTNVSTAAADTGDEGEGGFGMRIDGGPATGTGSGGCVGAAGDGGSCPAGGGKGVERPGGAGKAAAGVNWTAVVRWLLPLSLRMENVQMEVSAAFSSRAVHADKHTSS